MFSNVGSRQSACAPACSAERTTFVQLLRERLRLDDSEVESLIGVVTSQFDLSIESLLRSPARLVGTRVVLEPCTTFSHPCHEQWKSDAQI
jgi:hypothetical protein